MEYRLDINFPPRAIYTNHISNYICHHTNSSLYLRRLKRTGPFQLQEIVEKTLDYLHSWQDGYNFATTCTYIYFITINRPTDLPWILEPEDLNNKCILPKETARFLVLFQEIINTPANIKNTIPGLLTAFSLTTKIFISDSTLLSKNCAKSLLTELNKSNRHIKVYIDKKDKA
ncbi:hypothetical protein BDC45DRAFT_553685, partial [Circinella umbellata]